MSARIRSMDDRRIAYSLRRMAQEIRRGLELAHGKDFATDPRLPDVLQKAASDAVRSAIRDAEESAQIAEEAARRLDKP